MKRLIVPRRGNMQKSIRPAKDNENGRGSLMRGSGQDITKTERAGLSIQRDKDRSKQFLEIADVILLTLDREARITAVNHNGCSILGWEETDLLGRNWIDTCLPIRDREHLRKSFQNLLAGDLAYVENPVLTRSGEEKVIRWRNSLLHDAEGRVNGTLSSGEDITKQKHAEESLRQLSGRLLRYQDEERRRIARDLHDSTGQELVALAASLAKLQAFTPSTNKKLRMLISESQALAVQCIREVRTLSYLLHPPMLEEAGLEDAVRHYIEGFTERSGIHVELGVSPNFGRHDQDTELTLFRVIQESLTNVQRHSGSVEAEILIDRKPGMITLEVSDKGRGISKNQGTRNAESPFRVGVGIASMRHRVKTIGGQLEIESRPNGTTIRVTMPLAH
jgi:PAS domain S-box-containing protein